MLAGGLLAALLGTTGPTVIEPTKLFSDTCLGGTGRLAPGSIRRVDAPPYEVLSLLGRTRAGLGHAKWVSHQIPYRTNPLRRGEVTGITYRIVSGSPIYLVVPGDRPAKGDFAGTCAVAWKGDDYLLARRSLVGRLKEEPDQILMPTENRDGYAYTFDEWDGYIVSVVSLQGWTALVATPKSASAPKGAR